MNLVSHLIYHFPVHDEPEASTWICTTCHYMNTGVVCTKCWEPRGTARAYGGDKL